MWGGGVGGVGGVSMEEMDRWIIDGCVVKGIILWYYTYKLQLCKCLQNN